MPQTGLEMSVVLPRAPELQGLQACQSADPFKLVPVCQFVTYKIQHRKVPSSNVSRERI